MNTNEFKFLVLNAPGLWQQGRIEADEDGKDTIRIAPEGIALSDYHTHVLSQAYDLGNLRPADFALDSCGIIYILDQASKALFTFDTGTLRSERAGCISFGEPQAIAVDSANVYVADGSRVFCLARANYQTRWQVSIEGGVLADIALGGQGRLYVLDTSGRQVFVINRAGRASAVVLAQALEQPVAIALDNDGKLCVLEGAKKQVLRFGAGGALESSTTPVPAAGFQPASLAVDREGNFLIGDRRKTGTLFMVDPAGKPTLVGYQGPGYRLAFNRRGDLYVLGESRIAFLKLATRYVSKGAYVTPPFDSNTPECRWHKVMVDAEIPANTRMSVRHYVSDSGLLPATPPWSEPVVNFRDALITSDKGRYLWFRIELLSDDLHESTPRIRSLRAYFPRLSYLRYLPATYQEDAAGREFLERFLSLFETHFSGMEGEIAGLARYFDASATPDAFLPWLSSWLAIACDENWESGKVRKLIAAAPELYHKRGTRDGIERIIEIYTGQRPITVENFQLRCLQEKVVKTKLTMDARAGECLITVAEAIGFRAEDIVKVGETEEYAVIDCRQGNMLRLRGRLRSDQDAGAVVRLVSVEEALYGNCPFQFCVLLKPDQVHSSSEFDAVRRIIDQEKPAHTIGGLKALQPWVYLDMHTYLGINTVLTEPVFVLGQSSSLSRDTALSDRERSGQVDLHSRVAIDTRLT